MEMDWYVASISKALKKPQCWRTFIICKQYFGLNYKYILDLFGDELSFLEGLPNVVFLNMWKKLHKIWTYLIFVIFLHQHILRLENFTLKSA